MQDELPPEEIEATDQSTAQDAEEENRAEEELGKAKEELRSLDVAGIAHLLETLSHALDGGDNKKILGLMWQLDQSELMIGLRNWWDRRSGILQKYLYSMEQMPLFRYLVGFGFLELKGVTEKNLARVEKFRLVTRKWTLRILAIFIPEIRPFQPLIDVCMKLEGKRQDLSKTSRPYLAKRRAAEEEREKIKEQRAA